MRSFFILILLVDLIIFENLFSNANVIRNTKKDLINSSLNQKQNTVKKNNLASHKMKKPKDSLDNKGVIINRTKNMALNLSSNGGSANYPHIAEDASGRYAYAIWKRFNGTNTIIQTAKTSDFGIVWTGSIAKKSLDLSLAGSNADSPQITASASGRYVYAIWTRFNGYNWVVQTAKSSDYGTAWTKESFDLSQEDGDAACPQITTDTSGRYVYVIWKWYNGANNVIQLVKSSDFGETWTSPKRVTGKYPFDLSKEGGNADIPQIITNADGRYVYAIWKRHNGANNIIQMVKSSDFGYTWTNPKSVAKSLSPNLSQNGQNADSPQIAADASGRYVYAIWKRYNGANFIIQSIKSSDFAQNWTSPKVVTGNALPNLSWDGQNANEPQIATNKSGKYVYAIWTRSNGVNNIIQMAKSSDFAQTWENPIAVTGKNLSDLSQNGQDADMPKITTDAGGRHVYAIWKRLNGHNNIIQSVKSSDFGSTWITPIIADGKLSSNLSQEGQNANYPQITTSISGKYAYAIWYRSNGIDNIIQSVKLPDFEIADARVENQAGNTATLCYPSKKMFLVEFKPTYFFYQDKAFTEIFGTGGFLALFGFDARVYTSLHVWLDIGYLHDKGKIRQADNAKITISFVPVSAGLKYQLKVLRIVNLYSKLGPSWFHITNKNYYPYFDRKITKMGFGFTIGIGCLVDVGQRASLDFIADYMYLRKKFTSTNSSLTTDVYIGGLAIGAGLGCKF